MLKKIMVFLVSSPLIMYIITLFIKDKTDFVNFIFNIYTSVKVFVIKLLTYKIPLWIIIVFCLIFYLLKKALKKINENIQPNWSDSFKKMEYDGHFFSWNYKMYIDNTVEIVDIKPICSCGCKLVEYFSQLKCPMCGKIYNNPSYRKIEELKNIIIYKIENNKI